MGCCADIAEREISTRRGGVLYAWTATDDRHAPSGPDDTPVKGVLITAGWWLGVFGFAEVGRWLLVSLWS
jgi:hypothetical protein